MTSELNLGPNREPWIDQALCAGAPNPELWVSSDAENSRGRRREIEKAKSICQQCPVKKPCLTYALKHNEPHGVWGGLTIRERILILKPDKPKWRPPLPALDVCGTTTGLSRHYRNREQPCGPCSIAGKVARDARRPLKGKPRHNYDTPPTPDPRCGTEAGAAAHKYRQEQTCDPCKQASTQARKKRNEKKET